MIAQAACVAQILCIQRTDRHGAGRLWSTDHETSKSGSDWSRVSNERERSDGNGAESGPERHVSTQRDKAAFSDGCESRRLCQQVRGAKAGLGDYSVADKNGDGRLVGRICHSDEFEPFDARLHFLDEQTGATFELDHESAVARQRCLAPRARPLS